MRKVLVVACACVSSAAVAAPTVNTPSGQPDVTFEHIALADAEAKIASACMDKGWQVASQTTNMVTCQIPFGGFKQALAGALLGNAYSTPPSVYAQFSMAQIGDSTRAQARAWMETQMAFGQVRRMDYTDAKTRTNLMGFLVSAGASLPNGTTFDQNYIGFENNKTDTSVLNVTAVFHQTPGEEAGLRVGDQVIALNGKHFKTSDEFGKIEQKVKEPTYTLSILRGGQAMTLTVPRRSPPAVGTSQYAALKQEMDAYRSQHP